MSEKINYDKPPVRILRENLEHALALAIRNSDPLSTFTEVLREILLASREGTPVVIRDDPNDPY
jgi:hypothetical protein